MEFASLSIEIIVFLIIIAVLAGTLDTLAGGGGLLTLPALLVAGVPPLAALGTNKLQSTMGTATASYIMLRDKRVTWRQVRWLMLTAFIGSVLGTIAVQFINTAALSFVIPLVVAMIGLYFLLAPRPGDVERQARLSDQRYQATVVPAIGWYDGMFGPGTGSFFAAAGVALQGKTLLNATAVAKTLNFATNFASLIVFIAVGQLLWSVGLIMMVGQFIGARLGAHFLTTIPANVLRWIIITLCIVMLARYGYQQGWLGG